MGKGSIRVYNFFSGDFGKRGGGIESFLTNVSQGMAESGIEFIILLDYGTANIYEETLRRNKVRLVSLHGRRVGPIRRKIDLMRYLRSELSRDDIFVVHASNPDAYLLTFTARLCGVKHILFHIHSTPTTLKGSLPARAKTFLCNSLLRYTPTMRVACSKAAGRAIFGDLPFEVVHNGIEGERFRYNEVKRQELRKSWHAEQKLVIGQIARLAYQKKQSYTVDLVDALRRQGLDCCAILVGDGPDREMLTAHIKEKGLEDEVHILSPTHQVQHMYSAFDVFAFPSEFEGLGIVALEAQAAGLPTLCSDRVPDDVMLTDHIWKLPLAAQQDWVEKIKALARTDLDRNAASEDGIRAVGEAGFTIGNARNELIGIYKRMLR